MLNFNKNLSQKTVILYTHKIISQLTCIKNDFLLIGKFLYLKDKENHNDIEAWKLLNFYLSDQGINQHIYHVVMLNVSDAFFLFVL